MDVLLVRREVHDYSANGGPEFERVAETWRMLDVNRFTSAAQKLVERINPSGPLAQGALELVHSLKDAR